MSDHSSLQMFPSTSWEWIFLHSSKLLEDIASNTLVNSTTGDTLHLTWQPSGDTASVIPYCQRNC